MPARTPSGAASELKDALQRVLSCVTNVVLQVSQGGHRATDTTHTLFTGPEPVRLSVTPRIGLAVRHGYRLVQVDDGRLWSAETAGYAYTLSEADGREIVAYPGIPRVGAT